MKLSDITLVMLAAGQSRRFGRDDKLLAPFHGQPLGAYAARLMTDEATFDRVVIVPKGAVARQALFVDAGWTAIENANPEHGQSSSLKIAVEYVAASDAKALVFCLADMPFIRDNHIRELAAKADNHMAIMCNTGAALTPPALFERETFPALMDVTSDQGAKSVFQSLSNTGKIAISPLDARDIDTPDHLMSYAEESFADG